jgi:hypothetical protein
MLILFIDPPDVSPRYDIYDIVIDLTAATGTMPHTAAKTRSDGALGAT